MKKYTVTITKAAMRDIKRLPISVQDKILTAIHGLAENPRPHNSIKMTNRPEYRLRVGNYRVVYWIYDDVITVEVTEAGDRKDIYR